MIRRRPPGASKAPRDQPKSSAGIYVVVLAAGILGINLFVGRRDYLSVTGAVLTLSAYSGLLIWLFSLRRHRIARLRIARGLCAACGYDLRECKKECPECGKAVPAGHQTRSQTLAGLDELQGR